MIASAFSWIAAADSPSPAFDTSVSLVNILVGNPPTALFLGQASLHPTVDKITTAMPISSIKANVPLLKEQMVSGFRLTFPSGNRHRHPRDATCAFT